MSTTMFDPLGGKAVSRLIGGLYRRGIRRFLPDAGAVRYAGFPVALDKKLGDDLVPRSLLPFMHYDIDDYEATLIGALRETVREGNRVTIVGGGVGVTAVVAAQLSGASGRVICFEGSATQIGVMRNTFARNNVEGAIDIRHAIVAKDVGVYGHGKETTPVLPADQLPECDVLELDCEGAEILILPELNFRPGVLIVETHGLHGAPTADVRAALVRLGYDVEDRGFAEPSRLEECSAGDIRILLARRL